MFIGVWVSGGGAALEAPRGGRNLNQRTVATCDFAAEDCLKAHFPDRDDDGEDAPLQSLVNVAKSQREELNEVLELVRQHAEQFEGHSQLSAQLPGQGSASRKKSGADVVALLAELLDVAARNLTKGRKEAQGSDVKGLLATAEPATTAAPHGERFVPRRNTAATTVGARRSATTIAAGRGKVEAAMMVAGVSAMHTAARTNTAVTTVGVRKRSAMRTTPVEAATMAVVATAMATAARRSIAARSAKRTEEDDQGEEAHAVTGRKQDLAVAAAAGEHRLAWMRSL
ncbi:hypothetical protein AK812_SmicGene15778 [Symbiodinium microadriaticum]|uniref:Uncharacterized protein n=1 Tax=Symbiodinium microadriaticum TaxID=2951 RepID=A0A1Q9E237_SYMMI|nr:hypothetical protein AK812_SmicGene15778 [Symbiodinium microadriaticum]